MSAVDQVYVIWSHQHCAWWGPDHRGYVQCLVDAGRYTREEAADIVLDHVPPGEEVAVLAAWAARAEPGLRGLSDRVTR